MRTTINIRQHGDKVYFLNRNGFQKGSVKRTIVISEKHKPLEITYYVTCPAYNDEYMGDEVESDLLFDSYEQMLSYYSSKKV